MYYYIVFFYAILYDIIVVRLGYKRVINNTQLCIIV